MLSCRPVEVSAEDFGWVCLRRLLWMTVGVYSLQDLSTHCFLQGAVLMRQLDRDRLVWSGAKMQAQVRALDGYVFHTDRFRAQCGEQEAMYAFTCPPRRRCNPALGSRSTSAPPLRPRRTATSNHDVFGASPGMVRRQMERPNCKKKNGDHRDISLLHWDCCPLQTELVSLLIDVLRRR